MSQINTRIRIEAAIGVIRRHLAPARPPPWNRASETKQSEIQHACWLQSLDWDRVVAHLSSGGSRSAFSSFRSQDLANLAPHKRASAAKLQLLLLVKNPLS